MKAKHKRAYQYRFYPTVEQQHILARTFGCVRFVYNYFLHLRKQSHLQEQKSLRYQQTSALLTQLKRLPDYTFLGGVSCVTLQQALRHLERAFTNFFEGRAQYPIFKKKHHEQSAEYTRSAFTWNGTHLTLAKMQEPLAIRWSRPLPTGCKPTTVTVTKDSANRYFVSFLVEEEIAQLPAVNKTVGLDLGLTSMVVLSTGESVGNPGILPGMRRNWRRPNVGSPKRRKAAVTGQRLVRPWPVSMPELPTGGGTTSTNSRHALSAKTK